MGDDQGAAIYPEGGAEPHNHLRHDASTPFWMVVIGESPWRRPP